MEEELWYMQQQSRVLQDFRISIQALWDDEAARHINRSLLIPHQEDDEEMVKSFGLQFHYLNESTARRLIAHEHGRIASELSEQIQRLIQQIDDDIEISIQFGQQYRSSYAESQGLLPEVDKLLQNANTVGNGAPPYEP